MKRTLSIILVFVLISTLSIATFAGANKKARGNAPSFVKEKQELKIKERDEAMDTIALDEENEENEENELDELDEDDEKEEKAKGKTKKEKIFKNIQARRNQVRNSYSEKELKNIEKAKEKIEKHLSKGMKALSVDSIISNKGGFKFDTPPVIKNGRTIIPVRAISEGLGADVGWDGETRTVTITKGETVIELSLDSNIAFVNGEEVTLDSNSEILNSRTYVPLRFVSEALGINVEWDEETETIELEDLSEDTTTDAITDVEEEVVVESDEETSEPITEEPLVDETADDKNTIVEEGTTVTEEDMITTE